MQWVQGASPGLWFNTEEGHDYMVVEQAPAQFGAFCIIPPGTIYLGNFSSRYEAESKCVEWQDQRE